MMNNLNTPHAIAPSITKAASKQTYYTIRFLADRKRIADAYRAYGYFRWVDDVIDEEAGAGVERIAFVHRQKSLLESCYRGEIPNDLCIEEWMLADLIHNDTKKDSGLQTYLRNMMDVMVFDAHRRGQVISQTELCNYSYMLAKAVTEAIYYFIGHDDIVPCRETRYMAVTAAHITHMLRDAMEDVENGYFNIPQEYLQARKISPQDVTSRAYREWVCGQVRLARGYFKLGRECTSQIRNLRCRLAVYAYTARFEWMLDTIEHDHYCLRSAYPERKSLRAGLWMTWHTLLSMFASPRIKA
ncbi:MAG TPA: squalene/phytoene synthase family protein [Anaerolineales bacterium]|nr:squalene/phytoene synthase family protein [Anaerolineales bacterium]